jgi:hypothetical protein
MEIDKLYEATNEILLGSGLVLLVASLAISYFNLKLSTWGAIIGVLTILAGFNSPLHVIRA